MIENDVHLGEALGEACDLREALGKPASSRLVGSVNKDLVKLNDHDVSPHLASWWLAPA